MQDDLHILVCNDDGIDAPGIRHLAEAVADLGRLSVVAPAKDHSGASSSLSLRRTIAVHNEGNGYFRVEGTPSDCVHLALTGKFLATKPDLILSGINDGSNLGDDTIYSGTVAAAIEGHLFDIPGFAFSMVGRSEKHFAAGAAAARRLVDLFLKRSVNLSVNVNDVRGAGGGVPLWNVNIPNVADAAERDIIITRLGRRNWAGDAALLEQGTDGDIYRIGDAGDAADKAAGTDFHAVENGYISLTPLMIDLTDAPQIPKMQEWLK